MTNGKGLPPSFFFAPLLLGIMGLANVMRNSRFAAIHTVNVVQLIASGICFGVALAGILAIVRRREKWRSLSAFLF
jgi:hypothetical protein